MDRGDPSEGQGVRQSRAYGGHGGGKGLLAWVELPLAVFGVLGVQ